MKLTIIITVYNKEHYLKRALNALLGQEGTVDGDYEILAVNDGSTDNSWAILKDYSIRDSRVHILNQNNQGLSMARNNGLDAAFGEYVWFVDADDVISLNSVNAIIKATESRPDVIPLYAVTNGVERIRNQISPEVRTGKDVLLSNWEHCGVFWVMRKEFLINNNLRFFSGIYHEDAEFTPRMLYSAKSVKVIPHVLYTVYRDPNSITQIPKTKRAFDCLTVAERLNHFKIENKEQGTDIGRVIDYNISVIVNNGFHVICFNTRQEQKLFNKVFDSKRELICPLMTSGHLKYRIEALIFKLFPINYVGIYKFLNYFNRRQKDRL